MLTIPRLIRHTFKFDRALLGELYRAAHSAITTKFLPIFPRRTRRPRSLPSPAAAGLFSVWGLRGLLVFPSIH